jgi:hypothetical protein
MGDKQSKLAHHLVRRKKLENLPKHSNLTRGATNGLQTDKLGLSICVNGWQMKQTDHHLGRSKNLKISWNTAIWLGGPQTVYKRTQWDCPFVLFVSMVTNEANGQMVYKRKRPPFPSSQLCNEGHAHTVAEPILKFARKPSTHTLVETIPKFATNARPTLSRKRYWNLQWPNCATVFRFPTKNVLKQIV